MWWYKLHVHCTFCVKSCASRHVHVSTWMRIWKVVGVVEQNVDLCRRVMRSMPDRIFSNTTTSTTSNTIFVNVVHRTLDDGRRRWKWPGWKGRNQTRRLERTHWWRRRRRKRRKWREERIDGKTWSGWHPRSIWRSFASESKKRGDQFPINHCKMEGGKTFVRQTNPTMASSGVSCR